MRPDLEEGYEESRRPRRAIPPPGRDLRAPSPRGRRILFSVPTAPVAPKDDPEALRACRSRRIGPRPAGGMDGWAGANLPEDMGVHLTAVGQGRRRLSIARGAQMTVSRRTLLKSLVALGAGGAAARTLAGQGPDAPVETPPAPAGPAGRATEAAYRKEFAATYGDGESHGHAYHCVNCQGNCAWDVWTDAGGRITRENQSASYPAIAPDVPDANPRGCNEGVQRIQILYQPDRLLHPHAQDRGAREGKWKRISWDEAITEVATHLYETMLGTGPAGNYVHMGSGMLSEARAASVKRLGTLLGAVRPYIASYVGDMFPGVSVVYGEGNLGCTYDFVYGSDVALFWGCNPNTSRIPDAHYLWEGKYRGARSSWSPPSTTRAPSTPTSGCR